MVIVDVVVIAEVFAERRNAAPFVPIEKSASASTDRAAIMERLNKRDAEQRLVFATQQCLRIGENCGSYWRSYSAGLKSWTCRARIRAGHSG